ncbi:aftiphilin a isoform X2 [Syngnathus scovelli]|uniref:aftiphilin a isoform X2 n=1 Tax=Syngnathus scovelli TaxID=161590 RepID=UPI00210F5162|nr:aftiphilin a isoform X2 [Syngnathus scovelli]
MEPDVIRLYSSSPPPMEDAEEEEEDEFGDFSSVSAGEPDAPGLTSFAAPPLELFNGPPAAPGACRDVKANGVAPGSHLAPVGSRDRSDVKRPDCHVASGDGEIITNGFASSDVESGPPTFVSCHDNAEGDAGGSEAEFADFAAFSHSGHHRGCAAHRTAAQPDGQQSDCGGEQGAGGVRCQGSNGIGLDVDHVGVEWITVDDMSVDDTSVDDNSVDDNSVDNNSVDNNSVDGTSVSDAGPDGVRVDGGPEGNAGVDPAGVSADGGSSDGRTSDTEPSLGRPLSTDGLEEYADLSATGSPPLLREENATLADRSQLDEDDEEFGDFGDAGPLGEQAFAGSNCREVCSPQACDDFGDFKAPKADADEEGGASFGHFAAADARWSAFGEETEGALASAEASWAPFGSDDVASEAQTSAVEQDGSRRSETPRTRVEKLLEASFPRAADAASPEERVASLKTLLEAAGSALGGGVWPRLRDVHQAVGLRHQWGGSYCNKTLLACLGIDTRNILFTGQKKQPLIVPVYAASLGMLEPTKEPAKPVSAAEMIASIAQAPPAAAQGPSDAVQEALPPVQFDWSSSGLTNPLDGVDPELVELTTAKMDSGGAGSRVADAFARLMSTVDRTSTSTRRTRKDEKLSSEAAEVICGLPDLSFMTAKVLMFPATLVPLSASATPD